MKDLPPFPPVYVPPPDRWFDRHEHTDTVTSARTMMAMLLTVYDRIGILPPVVSRRFTAAEGESFYRLARLLGTELMTTWRSHCDQLSKLADPESAFSALMTCLLKGHTK